MLRTLLLVSDPLDASIQIADDLNKLEATLATLAAAEFVVQIAEVDAVSDLLARPHAPFTILHYLGHGTTLPVGDAGALVFEDRHGAARRLDPMQLFLTLNPTGTTGFQLALLSACHSERVAQACLHLGIQHIIAIEGDESVYEIAAVHFYRRFYTVLLSGGTVQQAFTAGQRAVALHEELGGERGRAEAAKFKLLPAAGDHAVTLVDAQMFTESTAAPVQLQPLPRLTQPPFHQRPAFFVGRNADLLAVIRLLRESRALIVTGVSGVGKSELARELAHRLVARRWVAPERVYFVALGNTTDAHGVRTSLTIAIGLSAELLPTLPDLADSWLTEQLPTHALFILDEAENAIHRGGRAVYNLLETLAQQPHSYLLMTSQNEIGSPHLPVYQLTRLLPAAALQLFVHSAKIVPAEWQLLDLTDLDAVLAMVDRLPRAIELVAKEWRYRHSLDFSSLRADLERLADQIMHDQRYADEVKSVTVGIQLAYTRLQERSAAAATLFAQIAAEMGDAAWQTLTADLVEQAETWRLAGVAVAQQAFGTGE